MYSHRQRVVLLPLDTLRFCKFRTFNVSFNCLSVQLCLSLAIISTFFLQVSRCSDLKALDTDVDVIALKLDVRTKPQQLINIPLWKSIEVGSSLNPGITNTFQQKAVHLRTPSQNASSFSHNWKILLILQHMRCYEEDHLLIKSEGTPLLQTWCHNSTFSSGNSSQDSVSNFVLSGYSNFVIETHGQWRLSFASLTATIFYETDERCDCDPDLVCCTSESQQLISDTTVVNGGANKPVRSSRCFSKIHTNNTNFDCGIPPISNSAHHGDDQIPRNDVGTEIYRRKAKKPVSVSTTGSMRDGCDDDDGNSILTYILVGITGIASLGFICAFFGVYIYRQKTDWKIQKESGERRFSFPNPISRSSISPSDPRSSQDTWNDIDRRFSATDAAMNYHRLSDAYKKDTVLGFEDID